jgi:hypothetical protein
MAASYRRSPASAVRRQHSKKLDCLHDRREAAQDVEADGSMPVNPYSLERQMRNSKHGLRALGLSFFAALGLMAFTAAVAQAGNGIFTVGGSPATTQAINGAIKALGAILIPSKNLQLLCHKGTIVSANFLNSKEALGKILFEECLVLTLKSEEIAGCHITNGLHVTSTFLVLAVLHNGNLFLLFEPDAASPLELTTQYTAVTFEKNKGCVLPLSNPVKGSVSAEVTTGLESNLPLIEFSHAIQLLTGDGLHYGTSAAFIDGGATVETPGKSVIGVH